MLYWYKYISIHIIYFALIYVCRIRIVLFLAINRAMLLCFVITFLVVISTISINRVQGVVSLRIFLLRSSKKYSPSRGLLKWGVLGILTVSLSSKQKYSPKMLPTWGVVMCTHKLSQTLPKPDIQNKNGIPLT